LHPLESAAFSRRTQIAAIRRGPGERGQIDPRRAETTLVPSSTLYRAIESQNGLIERYAGLSRARRIEFHVGIHLGNVVEEVDGDVVSINVG
jgi:hypothetical protein